MKTFLLLIALLCAVFLSSNSATSVTGAAKSANKQRAVTTFNQPVQLMGLRLRGEYLFVHDDEAMMRGQACTHIYKGNSEREDKLVISFHCTPATRGRANSFTVRTVLTATGEYEVTEFQFAGDTEAHRVPLSPPTEYVNIAPPVN
ncbi:MAG TPA: hypothetical protein VGJ55_05680 [Pyrinomonadaceae bacterium]